MAGYINFGSPSSVASNEAMSQLILSRSWAEINSLAYNISYAAASYGYTTPGQADDKTFQLNEWRDPAFEFCHFNNMTCSLVVFNSYDPMYKYVNAYYFQIETGACTDTFTISNWSRLQDNPPTSLTELYYQCFVNVNISIVIISAILI